MSTTGGRSAQWKFPIVLERSLFSAETRPLAIRNLYARANAPGDVRLSCQYSFSRGSNRQPVVTKSTNVNEQCQCVCGRCHQEASSSSSASHHHHEKSNENGQTESEYGTSRSCDCCRRESTNSSSSSVVTWSSITSSTFDPPHSHLLHLVKAEQQHKTVCQQQQQQRPKHTEALSSFSSGEYFTEPKTIDDFFRKNNVESQKAAPSIANTVTTVCTCSCSKEASGSQHFESSSELGSVIQQTNASQVKCSDAKVEDQVDGWSRCHWWPGGADDEHRRWSTAFGSSPLKPVKLDETSVWLRENIETRRVCVLYPKFVLLIVANFYFFVAGKFGSQIVCRFTHRCSPRACTQSSLFLAFDSTEWWCRDTTTHTTSAKRKSLYSAEKTVVIISDSKIETKLFGSNRTKPSKSNKSSTGESCQ